ncbi:MAG: SUMF1/EgtB/PvdO family nonheme iron enzyme [Spirochaetaceae bacterium]|jgi:formylglycine-generating enzyme required for sulfatase activity/TolB-like protein|nr:SUMF1/EgtB/PvdO family nonheme iron enzyme [Spirochaetaceae bacterium]
MNRRLLSGFALITVFFLSIAGCKTASPPASPADTEDSSAQGPGGRLIPGKEKETLAILPFTGAQGEDGETIAELFSFQKDLTALFNPVPRTSITRAIRNEQGFQMTSGMTNPDTIAALGKQLGARYVVSGTITQLGEQNLLVIAILHTEDLRQIAGDIQTYRTIEEIESKLPGMARNIAAAVMLDASELPLLAIPPVQWSGETDNREADTLAQILAVHLIRSEKYAVYPRTKSLEQVQEEYNNQFGGDTADEYLPHIGKATNPRLVLSVTARKLGSLNKFNAAVINLETGIQEAGDTVNYQSIADGMSVMEELALKLTGQEKEVARLGLERRDSAQAERERREAEAAQAERERREAEAAAQREQERRAQAAAAGMVLVPAGTFMMGSNEGDSDEKPVHRVTISKPFYMSKYEITQQEWRKVMGNNPSYFKGDNLPVEKVSWYDAIEYCNRRSVNEGLTPAYMINGSSVTWNRSANGYRLPTEAEWEYAARSGGKDTYTYAGSNSVDSVAWYDGNSGGSTQAVGTRAANSLGLYDMSGNVWEWCWDWYGSYGNSAVTDPMGAASGSYRVRRGGGWNYDARDVRSAYRNDGTPTNRLYNLGLRVVRP